MMTKEEIVLQLVCSLNAGNSGYICERVHHAIGQYAQLVEKGIIKEDKEC